jgi:hypothetical protein
MDWITRLLCDVPAVISRWKQKNARGSPRVSWIFATSVPGAAWKRSAPSHTKRVELGPGRQRSLPELRPQALFYARQNQTNNGGALTEFLKSGGDVVLGNRNNEGARSSMKAAARIVWPRSEPNREIRKSQLMSGKSSWSPRKSPRSTGRLQLRRRLPGRSMILSRRLISSATK